MVKWSRRVCRPLIPRQIPFLFVPLENETKAILSNVDLVNRGDGLLVSLARLVGDTELGLMVVLHLCIHIVRYDISFIYSTRIYLCMYLCMFETYLLLNRWTDLENSFFVSSVLVRGRF